MAEQQRSAGGRLSVIAIAVLLGAAAWHGLRPLADLDLWWHIQLGAQIVKTGTLIPEDVFSHSHAGAAWPWKDAGAAVLLYGLDAIAGTPAIVLFKAAVFLATAIVLLVLLVRVRKLPLSLAVLTTSVAVVAAAFRFNERPSAVSLLLIAIVVLLIERDREGMRGLWWAIPITILNANLHRGVLLVPVVLGTYAAVLTFEHFVLRRDAAWRRAAMVAAGSALACLATPFGTAIITTTTGLMTQHVGSMTEWAPVKLGYVWRITPATFVMFGMVVVGAALGLRARPRQAWDLALAALALALASQSMRHLPYLALLGAGPAATGLAAFRTAWSGDARNLIANGAAAAAFAAVLAVPLPGPSLGLAAAHYPERGVAFVRHLPERLELRGPMLNEFAYGGFLIYHLWPEHRVYIDGRTDLVYPPAFVQDYVGLVTDPTRFADKTERFGITWLFLDHSTHLPGRAHIDRNPDWVLVHISRRALIYVRREGPNAELSSSKAYALVRPHELERSLREAVATGRGAQALAEAERMVREDPENPRAAAAVALVSQLTSP